jgi:hypothetical protein
MKIAPKIFRAKKPAREIGGSYEIVLIYFLLNISKKKMCSHNFIVTNAACVNFKIRPGLSISYGLNAAALILVFSQGILTEG